MSENSSSATPHSLGAAARRYLRGMPPVFWWLWTGQVVSALATFVWPFMAVFLTGRGFSPAKVGLMTSCFGAGGLVAGPVGGWFADRFGRRPTILAGLVVAGFTTVGLALVTAPVAIAVLVFGYGLAAMSVRPATMATISDVVPESDRPRAMGLAYWGENIGVGVSLLAGGALARFGWSVPFLLDAATTLTFAALVWGKVPETRPETVAAADAAPVDSGYGPVLRDGRFVTFLVLVVVTLLVLMQFSAAATIDMSHHGFSPAVIGGILFVNTALIATVQPISAGFIGRFAPRHVLTAAALLFGVGFGSYALGTAAWHFGAGTAVWSLGEIVFTPVAGAIVASLAPEDKRGRYMGAFGLAYGAASLLAPLIGPTVLQTFGAPALWTGCLALGVAVAPAFTWLLRPAESEVPKAVVEEEAAS